MAHLRFVTPVLAAFSVVHALAAQDAQSERYANVPTESEVVQVWEELKADHVLLTFPGLHHGRPPSRFERAVDAHSTYAHIKFQVTEAIGRPQFVQFSPLLYAKNLHKVEFLLWAHSGELVMMGVDLSSVRKGLDETAQKLQQFGFPVPRTLGLRFRDVPAGHWASSAVHSLRDVGVLKGYPDARFRP